MNSFWKVAAPVTCMVAICAAVILWQVYKHKGNETKLAEDARAARASAEHGDAKAEIRLGSMYYYGEGVSRDYSEALRWFRRAADQGAARAQYDVGHMYDLGKGVPQDDAEALRWYRKAADQGEASAECSLGSMTYNGRGVQQDAAVAANLYRRAADQGLARAEYDLGYLYYYGQGVTEDRAEADRLYRKAADQGDANAQRALGLRSNGLSPLGVITLAAMFLGCLWVLKDPLPPGDSLRNRQLRALTLVGLLGLAYVGMSLYRVFAVFHSVLAVNAFYFTKGLVVGISIALAVSVAAPKGAKFVLCISGMLFIGTNFIVIAHQELRHFAATVRGFSLANGLLLGISIPLALFLWRGRARGIENRDSEVTA
jgi:hypothetical protein